MTNNSFRNILNTSPIFFLFLIILNDSTYKKILNKISNDKYVQDLHEFGVTKIPSLFSEEDCNSVRRFIDDCEGLYGEQIKNDFRIVGIETLNKFIFEKFSNNPLLVDIGKKYYGKDMLLEFTMSGKLRFIEEYVTGSGGDWHRDSFTSQYKNIAYLSDVDESHGPFEYISSSHTYKSIYTFLKQLRFSQDIYRYDDTVVSSFLENAPWCKKEKIIGDIGTVILADTRGVHRGSPILEGKRYALTNYFISPRKICFSRL